MTFCWLVFNLSGFKLCKCPRSLLRMRWSQGAAPGLGLKSQVSEFQEPQGCCTRDTQGFRSTRKRRDLGRCPAASQRDTLPPSHTLSHAHLIFSILWASIQTQMPFVMCLIASLIAIQARSITSCYPRSPLHLPSRSRRADSSSPAALALWLSVCQLGCRVLSLGLSFGETLITQNLCP